MSIDGKRRELRRRTSPVIMATVTVVLATTLIGPSGRGNSASAELPADTTTPTSGACDGAPPAPLTGYGTLVFEDFCDFDAGQWITGTDSLWDQAQQKFFLTPLGGGASGRLYYNTTGYSARFRAEFDYEIYGGSEAEGIVFAFVPYPYYDARTNGLMDFCDTGGGFGIEFDTFTNNWDPPERHVGVIGDCADRQLTSVPQETRGTHHVVIDFSAGNVKVTFDGVQVLEYMIPEFLELTGQAYFGLTSATGSADDNHVIDNLWITTASGFVVNHTEDTVDAAIGDGVCQTATAGECTLRAAIQEANYTLAADPILFNIPTNDPGYNGGTGTWSIQPGGPGLPTISSPVVLDATTQPGFTGSPKIELSGLRQILGDGLVVTAGNSLIRGLIINRFPDDGIEIASNGNVIQASYIGTDVAGSADQGNGGEGIFVNDASNNRIGGPSDNQKNTIAYNLRGVTIEGANAAGNHVHLDLMRSNDLLGIDLGGEGVTTNDAGDGDSGANGLQNFPVLDAALTFGALTAIKGTLNSQPSAHYTVYFYSSEECDAAGHGEGARYIGALGVITNGVGSVSVRVNASPAIPVGHFVTTTATDGAGNTSEFSICRQVGADVDGDADTTPDSIDNCPSDFNPNQANTDLDLDAAGAAVTGDALGDACDDDDDNDTWSDGAETVIGTNPLDNCTGAPGSGGDAWPADMNNSGFADTADIALLTNDFGDPVPAEAPARHDIAPDPPLAPPNAFVDTADIARLTGLFGRSCGP